MWQREDHKTRVLRAGDVLKVQGVIDITPAPERLINRRVTREQLELHHARRNQVIELKALAEAQRALEPMASSWWARLYRTARELMGTR
jgi:hypothetical protein